MATPSWDDPAILESSRGNSGKPSCLPRVLPRPIVWLPDQGPLCTDVQLALGFKQVYVYPSELWSLFINCFYSRREDAQRCTIGIVLSFLQERLEHRLSSSTLRAYVAAIAAHHDAVDGRFLVKQDLIVRFPRGVRRLHPPRPPLVPSWDLSIVLAGLQRSPVELLVWSFEQRLSATEVTRKGKAVSKQRLAHSIVDGIALAPPMHWCTEQLCVNWIWWNYSVLQ